MRCGTGAGLRRPRGCRHDKGPATEETLLSCPSALCPPGRIRTCDTRFRSSIYHRPGRGSPRVPLPCAGAVCRRRPWSLMSALDVSGRASASGRSSAAPPDGRLSDTRHTDQLAASCTKLAVQQTPTVCGEGGYGFVAALSILDHLLKGGDGPQLRGERVSALSDGYSDVQSVRP